LLRLLRVAAVITAVLGLAGPPLPVVGQLSECSANRPLLRYVVLFDAGTSEQEAKRAIREACGTTVAYYPQIGVGVVTSAASEFTARFGVARAYSAQSDAVFGRQRTQLTSRAVPLTAAQLPAAGRTLAVDHSAEQWDMEMIHAPQARAIRRGSPEVVVGVLDSGVDATHPDLADAVDANQSAGCLSGKPDQSPSAWSPSTSMHGTHVAGTIAAAGDGHGITGVAPGVRLASIKVVDDDGFIYPEYAVCGFMWAARQHMRIANNSYSLDPWRLTCSDQPGQAVVYEAIRRAVEYATAHGVLSVAAVGNDRRDLANVHEDLRSPDNVSKPQPRSVDQQCKVLPAQLSGVVAVSAVSAARVKSGYSSYGLGVITVTAPGGDSASPSSSGGSTGCVLSTIPGGYGYACGTSVATPHVSGVAALLASVHPDAGPQQLAMLLSQQATPLPCLAGHDSQNTCADTSSAFYGHGLVNAVSAVSAPN